jgi:chromosome segregation ATPase
VAHGYVLKDPIFFDQLFSEFFKSVFDSVTKPIVHYGHEPKKPERTEKDDHFRKKIIELESVISTLKGDHSKETSKLKSKINELESFTTTLKVKIKELETTVNAYQEQLSSLEKDQEDLFICLADQDLEINSLKEELAKK